VIEYDDESTVAPPERVSKAFIILLTSMQETDALRMESKVIAAEQGVPVNRSVFGISNILSHSMTTGSETGAQCVDIAQSAPSITKLKL
jgi:hypothetical protein